MTRLFVIVSALLLLLWGTAYAMWGSGLLFGSARPPVLTITSVSLAGNSYTSGVAVGATIGTASATLSSGTFTTPPGSWTTSGPNGPDFNFSGATLQANALTPTCSVQTAIPLNIVASYPNAASFTQAETITCNPAGSGATVCATPTPLGAAAADVTTAGFTLTLICADWTTNTGTNHVQNGAGMTTNWTLLSNWVAECGGPAYPTPSWHWAGSGNPPCSNLVVTTDPTDGNKQIVQMRAPNSEQANLMFPYAIFGQGTGFGNNIFPFEHYFEMRFRSDSATLDNPKRTDVLQAIHQGGAGHDCFNNPGADCYALEADHFELFSTQGPNYSYGDGSTEYFCHNEDPVNFFCGGSIFPPAIVTNLQANFTQQHTIGTLFTGDETTGMWKCAYLDGVLLGCDQLTFTGGNGETQGGLTGIPLEQHDIRLNKDFVDGMMMNYAPVGGPIPATAYLEYMFVMACPGSYLTTTQCPGTQVTHPPH